MVHVLLLCLFVPSLNGLWLADESMLKCEKELHCVGVRSSSLLECSLNTWETHWGE